MPQTASTGVNPVTLGAVTGIFYPNPRNSGTFDPGQLDGPVFSQQFPVINFDPSPSAQRTCPSAATINERRPYTDVIVTSTGQCDTEVATGDGRRAGVRGLFNFEAAFQTTLTVPLPGPVTFDVYSDDGWILGDVIRAR